MTAPNAENAAGADRRPRAGERVATMKGRSLGLVILLSALCLSPSAWAWRTRAAESPAVVVAPQPSMPPPAQVQPLPAGPGQADVLTTDDIRRVLQKARGQVVIVHLWATWCAPCLDELPAIDAFARAARGRGAVVLAYALDSDPRAAARVPGVLRARAPSLPAVVARFEDPDAFVALFSKTWEGSIPASFAFDRAGHLRRAVLGGATPPELDALLDQMLPPPPRRRAPATR